MAFAGNLNDADEMLSEINMVPLIDVMLVMLIIFIITVPVLTHSVNLDLPRADNRPGQIQPESITLSVSASGAVYWNDAPVDDAQLTQRLAQAAGSQPQAAIYIRGDRKVPYEHVAQVMAAVQRSGIEKLGFITEPQSP